MKSFLSFLSSTSKHRVKMNFKKTGKPNQKKTFNHFKRASRSKGVDWKNYELSPADEYEDSAYLRNLSVGFKKKSSVSYKDRGEEVYLSCLHPNCKLGWLERFKKIWRHHKYQLNIFTKRNYERHMAVVHGVYKDHPIVHPFIGSAFAKFNDEQTEKYRDIMVCPYSEFSTDSPCLATFKYPGEHAHNPYREFYEHYFNCHHQEPIFECLPKYKFEISIKNQNGERFQNCFMPKSLKIYRETNSFLRLLCNDEDLNVFRIADCGEVTISKVHRYFQGIEHRDPKEYVIYLAYPNLLLTPQIDVLYMDVVNELLIQPMEHNIEVRKYWETGIWEANLESTGSPTLSEMFREMHLPGPTNLHNYGSNESSTSSRFDSLFDEPLGEIQSISTTGLPDPNQENLHPETNEPLMFIPSNNPDPQTNPFRDREIPRDDLIRNRPPTPGLLEIEMTRPSTPAVRIPPRVLRELPQIRHLQPPVRIPFSRRDSVAIRMANRNSQPQDEDIESEIDSDIDSDMETARTGVRFAVNVIEI